MHGSTGSLTVEDLGGGNFTVLWSIDFTNFDDADAIATGHEYLTNVGFKAFNKNSIITLDDLSIGTFYYPSNVSNGGCDTSSSASLACVTLNDPGILATGGGTFSVLFNVSNGTLLGEESWSFRGKYGPDDGWVISENNNCPPIPEPTAALIFGLGALVVGSASRRSKL